MIYGFFGTVGSGKTITMTKYAYFYYLLGYNIYANYWLSFEHTPVTKEFLVRIVEENIDLGDNNVFILDEIDMYVDSRKSMKSDNIMITYLIKQVRKKDIKILYSSQYEHSVDRRLRDLTAKEFLCRSRFLPIKYEGETFDLLMVYNDIYSQQHHIGNKRFCANPYFEMYDTRQLITPD